jgi:hypothetical protein
MKKILFIILLLQENMFFCSNDNVKNNLLKYGFFFRSFCFMFI